MKRRDIMKAAGLAAAAGALEAMPATRAWLEKVQARPAYKAMLDVGV